MLVFLRAYAVLVKIDFPTEIKEPIFLREDIINFKNNLKQVQSRGFDFQ
mgnify:CR=1 FL=1